MPAVDVLGMADAGAGRPHYVAMEERGGVGVKKMRRKTSDEGTERLREMTVYVERSVVVVVVGKCLKYPNRWEYLIHSGKQ